MGSSAARVGRRVSALATVLIAVLALGFVAVRYAPASEAAETGALTGVAIPGVRILYDSPAVAEEKLDRVAALGVRWLRIDAAWSEIGTGPGRYEWSRVDRVLSAARARGLSVILILGTMAPWARPPGTAWNYGPTSDLEMARFAEFAAAAAGRYRGQVDAFEIWNEPNLPGSWTPAPSPDAYLRLLSGAYRSIHQVDPAAVVLSGGTGGGSGIDSVAWYTRLYTAGLRTVSDGIAVHPYPHAPVVDSGEMANAVRIRALMDERGDASKTLWGTEIGTPTGGEYSVTEATQAELVGAVYRRWRMIHHTGPLIYYTLMDFGGTDREDHFGLVRADGTEKPAFQALRDVAANDPG